MNLFIYLFFLDSRCEILRINRNFVNILVYRHLKVLSAPVETVLASCAVGTQFVPRRCGGQDMELTTHSNLVLRLKKE